MSKNKPISYYDRITNPIHKVVNKVVTLTCNIFVKDKVLDEKLNRIITRTTKTAYDAMSKLKKYKVSDFTLENLQSIGASDKLKRVSLHGDKFSSIDAISSKLDSLSQTSNSN